MMGAETSSSPAFTVNIVINGVQISALVDTGCGVESVISPTMLQKCGLRAKGLRKTNNIVVRLVPRRAIPYIKEVKQRTRLQGSKATIYVHAR